MIDSDTLPLCITDAPAKTSARLRHVDRPVNWAFIVVVVCGCLFAACVLFRINGSSSAFWAQGTHATDEPTGLLAGIPRATRSDEWMFWTPAALAQLHHVPPMPVENPALGAGAVPLLMSLPVRHYSMFFRPQLWGFFAFDAERGFAWFWNVKLFGLLLSYFLLFRLLTGGRVALAMLGSIAVTYSSSVQWFFSSPTMLPEMLTTWALMLVLGRSLFSRMPAWKKLLAATAFTAGGVNFVLCCYPPFQIPLVYLALTLFGVFVWEKRGASFHRGGWWLAAAILGTALVLWPILLQLRPTLEIISHTSYPGARRSSGGTMRLSELFSGVLNFFDGNRSHSKMYPNTSEASNFFPIWLAATAALLWRWWKARHAADVPALIGRSTTLCVALAAFIFCFSLYAVVGLPEWFCRVTALNFVTEKRVLLAIGIAGLMLAFLSLRADGKPLVSGLGRLWIPGAMGLAALAYLLPTQRLIPEYLSPGYVAIFVGLVTLLGSFFFCASPIVFASILSAALLANNFLVNPISEGLPLLIRSRAAQHIAAIHDRDPTALWAAYEHSITAQFITASGASVFNGIKPVPDLNLMGRLDPGDSARDIYNRYASIVVGFPRAGQNAPRFEVVAGDCYCVRVSPFEPALRAAGLKYLVFPRPLEREEASGMKLIDALPENLLWIYELEPLAVASNNRVLANQNRVFALRAESSR